MEHFVILFVDALLAIDSYFQKRIETVIPDLDALRENPGAYLTREDVVIGPRRYHALAVVIGGMIGITFSCGFCISRLDVPRQQPGPLPFPEQLLAVTSLVLPPIAAIALCWYWLRGGEIVLRPNGVVLRYRSDRVFCPWGVFVSAERPQYRKDRCALSPFPAAVAGIVYGRGNVVFATGYDVRAKLLRFNSGRLMVMRNMYAVRLKEILALLEHLAALLAESAPLPQPPTRGEQLPEAMS
jgi:hypothetical protein